VPAPADGTELLDDEDLDLFDDLDEVPEEPHSGTTNGADRLGTPPGGGDRVPGGAVR
jgi:hypothetical protein